jgi:hypothetical protein
VVVRMTSRTESIIPAMKFLLAGRTDVLWKSPFVFHLGNFLSAKYH